ncbi:Ig-like domain-containing protein [Brevibacillus sp. 179-C9.3 HS]|uniref:Ig-like domain-containing protein n=1 Tax=unclassified Brevibacillus TaxID=2684853 RepID=UPI00399F3DE1
MRKRNWPKGLLAAAVTVGLIFSSVGQVPALANSETTASTQKKISKLVADTKSITLKKAGTQQLTVRVQYADRTTEDVTQQAEWTSSDSDIARVEKGLVTAVDSGKTRVKASFGGKSVSIPVEIEVISKLSVDQKKLALSVGGTKQINATATFSDKTTADVTTSAEWESDDTEVVTVTNGLVTAVGSGKTKLKAKYGGKNVSISVEVDVVSKLESDQKKLYLRPDTTQSIKLLATLSNKEKVDVTSKAKWTSDNDKVATVENGVVTTVSSGKTKIKATYGGKTITIPVESAVISKLEYDTKKVTLKVGESKDVKVSAVYTDKTKVDITTEADWISTNSSIATVADGKITALKAGRTTIAATYNGKVVKLQITVK